MTFEEVLTQAIAMLQRLGRVSYRALKVQFQFDDDLLEILKDEIVTVHQLARDQEGKMLVRTGDTTAGARLPPIPEQPHAPLTYTPPHLSRTGIPGACLSAPRRHRHASRSPAA